MPLLLPEPPAQKAGLSAKYSGKQAMLESMSDAAPLRVVNGSDECRTPGLRANGIWIREDNALAMHREPPAQRARDPSSRRDRLELKRNCG